MTLENLLRYGQINREFENYRENRGSDRDLNPIFRNLGGLLTGDEDTFSASNASDAGISGLTNYHKDQLTPIITQYIGENGEGILEAYSSNINNLLNNAIEQMNFPENMPQEQRNQLIGIALAEFLGKIISDMPKSNDYNNENVNRILTEIRQIEELRKNNNYDGLKRQAVRERGQPEYLAGWGIATSWSNPDNMLSLRYRLIGANFLNQDNTINREELSNYVVGNIDAYARMAIDTPRNA